MKEKVLFVCERRDTILTIESELLKTKTGYIEKIFVNNVLYFNIDELDIIIEKCNHFDTVIVDKDAKYLDHLLLVLKNNIVVDRLSKHYGLNCIVGLQCILDHNEIEFSKLVNIKVNNYIPNSDHPLYTENDIEHLTHNDKLLIDIELFVNSVKRLVSESPKNFLNQYIYERNLKQILELLKEDFNKTSISNVEKVNETLRLMDKINYLRGQYK